MTKATGGNTWLRAGFAAGALAIALFSSSHALAQGGPPGQPAQQIRPPTPGKEDTSRPLIMTLFCAVIIVAAVVGANAIPSKRGHQD